MARPDHRLLEISHELERLAGQLSALTVERGARTPPLTPTLVRSILAVRLIAPDHLDRDLGEPARNMLLSLYAARLEGRDLPPTRLAASAAVPLATALHWIARMRERGLILARPHPTNRRSRLLRLSPRAIAGIEAYLAAILQRSFLIP